MGLRKMLAGYAHTSPWCVVSIVPASPWKNTPSRKSPGGSVMLITGIPVAYLKVSHFWFFPSGG